MRIKLIVIIDTTYEIKIQRVRVRQFVEQFLSGKIVNGVRSTWHSIIIFAHETGLINSKSLAIYGMVHILVYQAMHVIII